MVWSFWNTATKSHSCLCRQVTWHFFFLFFLSCWMYSHSPGPPFTGLPPSYSLAPGNLLFAFSVCTLDFTRLLLDLHIGASRCQPIPRGEFWGFQRWVGRKRSMSSQTPRELFVPLPPTLWEWQAGPRNAVSSTRCAGAVGGKGSPSKVMASAQLAFPWAKRREKKPKRK